MLNREREQIIEQRSQMEKLKEEIVTYQATCKEHCSKIDELAESHEDISHENNMLKAKLESIQGPHVQKANTTVTNACTRISAWSQQPTGKKRTSCL